MDEVDRAQPIEELFHQQALADFQQRKKNEKTVSVPDYRDCDDCGEEIPKGRLEAEPSTIRCTKCQTRFENMQTRMR